MNAEVFRKNTMAMLFKCSRISLAILALIALWGMLLSAEVPYDDDTEGEQPRDAETLLLTRAPSRLTTIRLIDGTTVTGVLASRGPRGILLLCQDTGQLFIPIDDIAEMPLFMEESSKSLNNDTVAASPTQTWRAEIRDIRLLITELFDPASPQNGDSQVPENDAMDIHELTEWTNRRAKLFRKVLQSPFPVLSFSPELEEELIRIFDNPMTAPFMRYLRGYLETTRNEILSRRPGIDDGNQFPWFRRFFMALAVRDLEARLNALDSAIDKYKAMDKK